jgi:uncharacterized protein
MAVKTISDEVLVSWQVNDIDVNGSLTIPEGEGPFPAVIMVAGSGPTDRNWNSPMIPGTNGSGALLARVLTDLGYVTLRYDKRASGPHGKENALKLLGKVSMQGHLDELGGGLRLLADRKEVDPRHIFALTNSEGCIHALNYQIQVQNQSFAGLVLTSAPARAIGTVARGQIAAQLKHVPGGDNWLAAYDAAMADFTAGRSVKLDENLPEGMRAMILSASNPINLPFTRELWVADPALLLSKVSIPCLIVIGKKDIQVDWQEDGSVFERMAKSHRNITFAIAKNANHVLKNEPRDRSQLTAAEAITAYNSEESRLDLECEDIITTWLTAQR